MTVQPYVVEVETSSHDLLQKGVLAAPREYGAGTRYRSAGYLPDDQTADRSPYVRPAPLVGLTYTVVLVSPEEVGSDSEAMLVAAQMAACTSGQMPTRTTLISWPIEELTMDDKKPSSKYLPVCIVGTCTLSDPDQAGEIRPPDKATYEACSRCHVEYILCGGGVRRDDGTEGFVWKIRAVHEREMRERFILDERTGMYWDRGPERPLPNFRVPEIDVERAAARLSGARLDDALSAFTRGQLTDLDGTEEPPQAVEVTFEATRKGFLANPKPFVDRVAADREKAAQEAAQGVWWWVSWYGDPEAGWEYHGPWWISGYGSRGDKERNIYCAAVSAPDELAAKKVIEAAYDDADPVLDWRFVEECPADRSPYTDRFQAQPWMKWPWPEED